jgi:hypothetical protein
MENEPSSIEQSTFSETTLSSLGIRPRQFTIEEGSANFPTHLELIEKMVRRREHCDTEVIIGTERFNCHMIVLSGYSDYFEDLKKNEEFDTHTVFLPEEQVSPTAFKIIYDWMLSDGDIPMRLHFAAVFKATKFLKVHEYLAQFMCVIDDKTVIGEREALSIYLEAKAVNEKSLQDFMRPKVSKLFLTFVSSWEYLELTFEEVESFFRSNTVSVNSELDMLFAAIRWLQHEWPRRHKMVTPLLKQVRFELMQTCQLVDLKNFPDEFKHIFKAPEVQQVIDNALTSLLQQSSNQADGDNEPKVINRRLINDPMWNSFDFETCTDFKENYKNFCKYLKNLRGKHWQNIKYADPKHESFIS